MPRIKDCMTHAEMKAMRGTEFIYQFTDGDTIRAYVKAYDPKVGLSCFSLEAKTKQGWTPDYRTQKEPDGTYCVMSVRLQRNDIPFTGDHLKTEIKDCSNRLRIIRDRGIFDIAKDDAGYVGGSVSCSFL